MSTFALVPTSPGAPYEALLIDNANMHPDVPRGSVVFIEPPGYTGEGIYSVPCNGRHLGDLRRIFWLGEGYQLKIDNWPEQAPLTVLSKDELVQLAPRRVSGIAKPFTQDFAAFLRHFASSA